jgi:hypothetical protein
MGRLISCVQPESLTSGSTTDPHPSIGVHLAARMSRIKSPRKKMAIVGQVSTIERLVPMHVALLALVLVAAHQPQAARPAGSSNVMYGRPATASCGDWTAEWKKADPSLGAQMGIWVEGFVSGASSLAALTGATFTRTDAPGIKGFIDHYCEEHAVDTVAKAAAALVIELKVK